MYLFGWEMLGRREECRLLADNECCDDDDDDTFSPSSSLSLPSCHYNLATGGDGGKWNHKVTNRQHKCAVNISSRHYCTFQRKNVKLRRFLFVENYMWSVYPLSHCIIYSAHSKRVTTKK